jgi:hypothetical protein
MRSRVTLDYSLFHPVVTEIFGDREIAAVKPA